MQDRQTNRNLSVSTRNVIQVNAERMRLVTEQHIIQVCMNLHTSITAMSYLQGRIQGAGARPPIFGKDNFIFYIVYNV